MEKAFLKCMLIFGHGLVSSRTDYHYPPCGPSSSALLFGLVACHLLDAPEVVFEWIRFPQKYLRFCLKDKRPWAIILGAKWGKSTRVSSHSACIFFSQSLLGVEPPLPSVRVSSGPQVSVLSTPDSSRLPNMHLRIQFSYTFDKPYFSLSLHPQFQRCAHCCPFSDLSRNSPV